MEKQSRNYFISGAGFDAPELAPGLYLVSTPIGNLRDITIRALETLAAADLVLCEDTRQSAKLLNHYGIETPRAPLHEHNERARIEPLTARLSAGAAIAMISDAGTPLLSDPGFPLVRAARIAGIDVFAIPGASALLAGLTSAGLPTDRFSFVGFLPPKMAARRTLLTELAARRETLVFYESPRRLGTTLTDMAEIFGAERVAAVGLELTKKFERFSIDNLAVLAEIFSAGETKGEAVIVTAGAPEQVIAAEDWQAALSTSLETLPLRAAVDEITQNYGLKRKAVYDAALALRAAKS